MSTRNVLPVVLVAALSCGRFAAAAERIELWPRTSPKPAETAAPSESAKTAEELRPARVLRAAAARAELPAASEIFSATAEALAGPATQPAEAPPEGEETEEEKPAAEAPKAKPAALPAWMAGEPQADYALVALAGGEFKHPKGQVLRAALYEFATAREAWGFWSVGRGEKTLTIGQGAGFGPPLRVWQGKFAAVLSLTPAEAATDELRLSTFARTLFALVPGTGSRPEMAGWLPLANQLPHTLTYFHAQGPLGPAAMALNRKTEGVAAQYRIGRETAERGAPPAGPARASVVRYPDAASALDAWDAFVGGVMGFDPKEGERGTRRVAPGGGGWSGIQLRSAVVAFVVGAPTRNQAQILLLQSLANARDALAAPPQGSR